MIGVVSALTANAGSIGPNCASCFGSVYTLTNLGQQGDAVRFRLTIDTGDYANALTHFISAIGIKVTDHLLGATVAQTPGGTGTWQALVQNQQVSNNGCSNGNGNNGNGNGGNGNGGGGWVCLGGGHANVGGVYTWEFDIRADSFLRVASIKANYDPPNGLITSETVAMPEGGVGELSFTAAGLAMLVMWRRTRRYLSIR